MSVRTVKRYISESKHIEKLLFYMSKELKCYYCDNYFKDPHTIPVCQHHFCKECLNQSFDDSQEYLCPICRTPVWKNDIKKNHMINNMLESFKNMLKAVKSCKKRNIKKNNNNYNYNYNIAIKRTLSGGKRAVNQDSYHPRHQSSSNNHDHDHEHVFLCSLLNSSEKVELERLCQQLGGARIVSNFSNEVTHLITNEYEPQLGKRTEKFLLALANRKCWILSKQYIHECSKEGSWLDENAYELQGEIVFGATYVCRNVRLNWSELLFTDLTFHIVIKEEKGQPSQQFIKELITMANGTIIENDEHSSSYLIVNPIIDQDITIASATVANSNWIMDCITLNRILEISSCYKPKIN